jgi:hypothetical protein
VRLLVGGGLHVDIMQSINLYRLWAICGGGRRGVWGTQGFLDKKLHQSECD